MKWEEFLESEKGIEQVSFGQFQTDIDCPKCGEKIFFNSTIVLTTYPPKYEYWCKCGWHGTSTMRWSGLYETNYY